MAAFAYKGAEYLHDDISTALAVLSKQIKVVANEHASHSVLTITGFESKVASTATAVYLVGLIAQCVNADLLIRQALFDDTTRDADLESDVLGIVGDEDATDHFKRMTRDPWLWEGISHLLIHLASDVPGFHPPGKILVKSQVKYDVNDHGLDLIAIYDCGVLGITAGESKAYLNDPTQAVGDAARRLSEVDQAMRDVELRSTVTQLRPALSPQHQKMLGGSFWRKERSYYPFVCCDGSAALDWGRKRKVLDDLNVSISRKLLVPLTLPQARQLLDYIAGLMRDYANGNLK